MSLLIPLALFLLTAFARRPGHPAAVKTGGVKKLGLHEAYIRAGETYSFYPENLQSFTLGLLELKSSYLKVLVAFHPLPLGDKTLQVLIPYLEKAAIEFGDTNSATIPLYQFYNRTPHQFDLTLTSIIKC